VGKPTRDELDPIDPVPVDLLGDPVGREWTDSVSREDSEDEGSHRYSSFKSKGTEEDQSSKLPAEKGEGEAEEGRRTD
jgi:hypothetical protein